MQHAVFTSACCLGLALALALCLTPAAEADDLTLGLKAWSASLSADNLSGGDDLFFPGFYLTWDVTDRVWISLGYLAGEIDFTIEGSTTAGSVEEVNSDLVVGWSFAKLDVGVGYRLTGITGIKFSNFDNAIKNTSSGPMVYLGGGDLFGQYHWGYYWAVAFMFEDLDDDDGAQKHINGEWGFRWTSLKNLSILFGYRYKEYLGAGTNGLTFDGPVVNLAYTWR